VSYKFNFNLEIVRSLQEIERAREVVRLTVLPPVVAERLRFEAHIRTTHFSTQIEGNRLTLEEAEAVIERNVQIVGRARDVGEVARYYQALQQVETWSEQHQEISESRIKKLHAILYRGKRTRPTIYRDGQNVIRDTTGGLVYLPPEAKDVSPLMKEMVAWINQSWDTVPIPIIAGMAHYQFVTVHPFFDGNGRTARTLTTWILYKGGYDLGKFYALEEFYAQDLQGYYAALVTHPHHNYYEGREDAYVTTWLEYYIQGMAVIFSKVAQQVTDLHIQEDIVDDPFLRQLDHRARRVLALFAHQMVIRSSDVASVLGVSQRQSRELISGWVADGWLLVIDPSRRGRKYGLAAEYRRLVD
jgi:Fic family protein